MLASSSRQVASVLRRHVSLLVCLFSVEGFLNWLAGQFPMRVPHSFPSWCTNVRVQCCVLGRLCLPHIHAQSIRTRTFYLQERKMKLFSCFSCCCGCNFFLGPGTYSESFYFHNDLSKQHLWSSALYFYINLLLSTFRNQLYYILVDPNFFSESICS